MNFNLTEEQEMLRKMARDFLTEKYPKAVVKKLEQDEKGYSPELWQEMAGLGWTGLVLPEKYGGAGMSFLDLAVLMEEMGRAAVTGPFFGTVVLGGLAILESGSEEQKQQFLPGISSGKMLVTMALLEANARYDAAAIQVKAVPDKDGYAISGTKLFVPDAHVADYLLVVARTSAGGKPENGVTVFVVDAHSPGLRCNMLKTIAGDRLCEVTFDKVRVPVRNVLGKLNEGWQLVDRILQRATIARCCEMVGAMQQALDMTVSYAKERKQFGKPIGTFEAIQHYCAGMVTDVEGARFAAYEAAWRLSEGMPCRKEAAVAKGWAADASKRVLAQAHQIHGAIGVTIDHDLQYYTRRLKAAEPAYGDADFQREIVAQEMGL